jgi:hypothetical protein
VTTIWKYPLAVTAEQQIDLPLGAQVLHVAVQHQMVCLWAQVRPDAQKQARTIRIFGTGHDLPDDPGRHIGSFMLYDGTLVFHAYEANT